MYRLEIHFPPRSLARQRIRARVDFLMAEKCRTSEMKWTDLLAFICRVDDAMTLLRISSRCGREKIAGMTIFVAIG
jgi:hypothetical protein